MVGENQTPNPVADAAELLAQFINGDGMIVISPGKTHTAAVLLAALDSENTHIDVQDLENRR
jgi:hypothetical protein